MTVSTAMPLAIETKLFEEKVATRSDCSIWEQSDHDLHLVQLTRIFESCGIVSAISLNLTMTVYEYFHITVV